MLRLLIADDEPLVRRRLRGLLEQEPDVSVVAECGSGRAVMAAIVEHAPDLAFLDIDMPGMDGLTAVKSTPPQLRPLVVFVTAHEAHAREAFELRAIGYLLKPHRPERVREALARARELVGARGGGGEGVVPKQRVVVRDGDRMIAIAGAEIDWIEGADDRAVIHVGGAAYAVRETLVELAARLAGERFWRISRNAVVNGERVREIRREGKGDVAVLVSGERLPMTRGLREAQGRG